MRTSPVASSVDHDEDEGGAREIGEMIVGIGVESAPLLPRTKRRRREGAAHLLRRAECAERVFYEWRQCAVTNLPLAVFC